MMNTNDHEPQLTIGVTFAQTENPGATAIFNKPLRSFPISYRRDTKHGVRDKINYSQRRDAPRITASRGFTRKGNKNESVI